MAQPERCDVVMLGSGEAGKHLAWSLGSQGKRTAVVERRYVGGPCPNIACVPSKNVIHSAEVANFFRRASEFGIALGNWKVEMPGVRDRKERMVDGEIAFHRKEYRKTGVELVMGQGRFVGPRTIEVSTADAGTRTLLATSS
jgi:pyruvate/2-oxoglutarate dehydrogenase complex dihydrolipoamide dehydrogenase (E3) component